MATVTTVDVTTAIGSSTFPQNANDAYGLLETICAQNIRALKSFNRIEDAFYDYVVDNGTVIEEAVVKMAEAQNFVKTGAPNLAPVDPTLYVKYFNNWESKQFETTIRKSDIRKILANKGTGFEEVVAEIMGSLREGESYYDFTQMAAVFDDINDNDYFANAEEVLFGDKVPASMKGVVYCLREMYNAIKATNTIGLGDSSIAAPHGTPVEDIRIAVSESVLNLIDVVELANIFNLSKEELFGKLVVIPAGALKNNNYVFVYDRKALGRGTRLFEYSQDVIGKGLYSNHYLTTERCYFVNQLYKGLLLNCSKAITAAKAQLLATPA